MKLLEFAHIVGKLKEVKRAGWVRRDIPNPESVADHSYRVAILALFLAEMYEMDQLKVVKMALIHDLGEAIIGDIVVDVLPLESEGRENKKQNERQALKDILALTDNPEWIELFDEYEKNETKEARFVKQLDKMEMGIQASEYENKYEVNLNEFFESTKAGVTDKRLTSILAQIDDKREYMVKK